MAKYSQLKYSWIILFMYFDKIPKTSEILYTFSILSFSPFIDFFSNFWCSGLNRTTRMLSIIYACFVPADSRLLHIKRSSSKQSCRHTIIFTKLFSAAVVPVFTNIRNTFFSFMWGKQALTGQNGYQPDA